MATTISAPTGSKKRPTQIELAAMLSPRSIAVVGASSDLTKFGGRFVPYLRRQGFSGSIYPINARHKEIAGFACYPTLSDVPGPVDCVIYAGAGADAITALDGCGEKGVKLVVVISSGFAELGDAQGRAAERALVEFAHANGARMIGPNCVGFLNLRDRIAATAASSIEWEPQIPNGRIGLVSQSGGIGMGSLLYNALVQGTSFSFIFSTGNEGDLDLVDFADFLLSDEGTDVICLTWESVRDGPAFLRFLANAQRACKPVVALVSGRSELGKQMAASHTGALAGSYEVFLAIADKYGIAVAEDLDDVHEIAQMFSKLRQSSRLVPRIVPVDKGCAAIGVSGGQIGLLADLAAADGMQFAKLTTATQDRLKSELRLRAITNPVDMSGGSVSDPGAWGRGMAALLADPGVAVGLPVMTIARNYDSVTADLEEVLLSQEKPVIVTWSGGAFEGGGKGAMQKGPLPFFSSPARTVRGLRALHRWQRAYLNNLGDGMRAARSLGPHPLVAEAAREGRTTMTEAESKSILSSLGFPLTREHLVTNAAEAVSFASGIGFPVALKGQHPRIPHKTEAGVVRLGLRNAEEVHSAYAEIAARMEAYGAAEDQGVLVQEMVEFSSEFLLGMHVDPVYGPMVMFGLGGIFVEVLKDVGMALAPLTHREAKRLVGSVRSAALLRGARGRSPVDLDLLADLVVKLGDFSAANAQYVVEIDINPLVTVDRADDNLRMLDALIVLRKQVKDCATSWSAEAG